MIRHSPRRVALVGVLAGLLVSSVATPEGALRADDLPVYFVRPDPAIGADDPDAGFTETRPFLTIQYALDRAAERARAGIHGATLQLLRGVYSDAIGQASQTFPVIVPAELEIVAILGPRDAGGPQAIGPATSVVPGIFQFAPDAGSTNASIELRDLKIDGGGSGLLLRGLEAQSCKVALSGCVFVGQKASCVHLSSQPKGKVAISISRCSFEGASGGVTALGGEGGELRLSVTESTFTDFRTYAPGGMLGAGVDVHLDAFSKVWTLVARCQFRGVASALQLTESEEDPARQPTRGEMHALFLSNVVNGLPADGFVNGPGVTNGIYLNLWPHHSNEVVIVNNTFVGVRRNVVYHDNLLTLAELALALPPITFANNVCHRTEGEADLDEEVFSIGEDAPGERFPSNDSVIHSNILDKSRRGADGTDGNLSADPRFLDEAAFDFRLAQDSPAVDHGDPTYAGSFEQFGEPNVADASGTACRRAARTCSLAAATYPVDLGANERPGFCDAEPAVFERGDCNASSGRPALTDAVFTFSFLFRGGANPQCRDACDSNDDGALNISDGIYTLYYLFVGGPALPPPHGADGRDPTRDCLSPCNL